MNINSLSDLEAIKNDFLNKEKQFQFTAHICYAAGCLSSDCKAFKEAFVKALENSNLQSKVSIKLTGCMGACSLGPTLIINPGNILYCNLNPANAQYIVDHHIKKGKIAEKFCYKDADSGVIIPDLNNIPFFKHQQKIVLRNCGTIDYGSVGEYISREGYFALAKVLGSMTPLQVIDEVKKSGLRGRGGGGFPVGLKWAFANKAQSDQKYIICNADEGDPGAFMDRSLLEGDAHSVIEGMVIGGYAIGASKGIVYIRAEYPIAVERLTMGIKAARELGLLGENIFKSKFKLHFISSATFYGFVSRRISLRCPWPWTRCSRHLPCTYGRPGPLHFCWYSSGLFWTSIFCRSGFSLSSPRRQASIP
jgi:NADH-quinone oxidoreductase subunit F